MAWQCRALAALGHWGTQDGVGTPVAPSRPDTCWIFMLARASSRVHLGHKTDERGDALDHRHVTSQDDQIEI